MTPLYNNAKLFYEKFAIIFLFQLNRLSASHKNTIFRIKINSTSVKKFDTVSPGYHRFPPKQPEIGRKR